MTDTGLHIVDGYAIEGASGDSEARDTTAGLDAVRTVLIHGAMDRHNSFRRVARRLSTPVVMYDRRGYGGSLDAEPPVRDLERHVADLIHIIDDRPSVLIGHSVGGLIALTAAAHFPANIRSVAAFEPPTGWKPWWPDDLCVLLGETPEQTVERFYRQIVGDSAWERLGDAARADLLREGPALQVDLEAGRRSAPFHFADIAAPVLMGHGTLSEEHHIRATRELADELPTATLTTIEHANHGAHRSHPDAFALFVERAIRINTG